MLLTRRHEGVELAAVRARGKVARLTDELVGGATHGGYGDDETFALLDFATDAARHLADAVEIADARPAELPDARRGRSPRVGRLRGMWRGGLGSVHEA